MPTGQTGPQQISEAGSSSDKGKDILTEQLPKPISGKTLLSPSQAPTPCLALAGACRREQGQVEEGIDMIFALRSLSSQLTPNLRGRPSQKGLKGFRGKKKRIVWRK